MSPRIDRLGFRFLIFVAVGLILAAMLAIALAIWWLRSEAIRDASRNAGNLAFVLAEQTNRSAQSIELLLNDLRERINASSTSSPQELRQLLQGDDTHQMLTERRARLSHISFISIVDKEGWIINSTNQWPLRPTNVADRAHFQYVKNHNEPGIYISDPIYDRLKGIQTLLFIKRINDANNEFLGTVVVGVGLSYFQHIYEALSKLHDLSFFLLRADGTVLVRYPDATNLIGEKIPPFSPWYELVNEGGGYYRSPGYFDGVARQIAARPLPDYPLVVNVAVSEGAALAAWRIQAMSIGGGSLLIISCLIFLLQALNKQFKRLAISESSLVQKARELEQSNAKVEVALNNMSQGLAMFDGEGRLVVCNRRYTEVYDLPADLARPGTPQADILHNRIGKGIYACGDPERYFEERVTTARGGKRKDSILELSNGRSLFVCHQPTDGGGWVSTHEDITERQRAEAKINHMARHDALTDLPNRLFLREQLEQSLKRVQRGERVAVLYLDLDQFKAINDTLGHSVGDVLLQAVAVRLRACLRDTDVVGRLGGDEFAIIQNSVMDEKDITNLVNRVFDAVRTQYDLDGRQLNINTSIGVSVAPTDGCDPEQLLRNADLAMYRAKADGRGTCRFFEPEMERRVKARLKLEFELRQAIMGEEFELYYQPLLSLRQNRVSGFEALLRWHHPTRGLISPAEFIPLAEETGLIAVLGEWVLKTACAAAASWPDDVKVAVNVSPVQFKDRNLVQTVVNALKATGLPGRKLVLEITEAVLLDDDEAVLIALHRLRELGIQIALDDFGTGYSSLSYLRRFPFDKIKIDRFFIKDVVDNDSSRSIIEAVVNIANSANITTVAEGVETEQQLKVLRKLGCTEIQGYLFSAPLTAPEILPLLQRALQRQAAVA
jgi:diguanylate cyclase (GGDEF)-like protein